MSLRAAAVLCVRNEELRIASALDALLREELDVVLIDHDSDDATVAIARRYLGRGLLGIERLQWDGCFSLSQQLEAKWRVTEQLDHDWMVHADADEWLTAPREGETLREALSAVDAAGYNCVNFDEFVFVPSAGQDARTPDYAQRLTRYYLYRPDRPFLLRAWKHRCGLDNRQHAGHLLSGPARWHPDDFPLRHYIVLSEGHAAEKYGLRPFDADEVARGWHHDRVLAGAKAATFPGDDPRMRALPDASSKAFDRSFPVSEHYWEWQPLPASPYAAWPERGPIEALFDCAARIERSAAASEDDLRALRARLRRSIAALDGESTRDGVPASLLRMCAEIGVRIDDARRALDEAREPLGARRRVPRSSLAPPRPDVIGP